METYLIKLTNINNFKKLSNFLFDNYVNNALYNKEEYHNKYENIDLNNYSILLLEDYFLLLENKILNYPEFLSENTIKIKDYNFLISQRMNILLKKYKNC